MRHLLCSSCSNGKEAGERLAYEAGPDGPAEYERIVFGTARSPLPDQRVIHVGLEAVPLAPDHYDCDACGGPIRPGERCCGWTAWVEHRRIPNWENEFMEVTP